MFRIKDKKLKKNWKIVVKTREREARTERKQNLGGEQLPAQRMAC